MGNCKYQIDVCEIQIRVVKFQFFEIQNSKFQNVTRNFVKVLNFDKVLLKPET